MSTERDLLRKLLAEEGVEDGLTQHFVHLERYEKGGVDLTIDSRYALTDEEATLIEEIQAESSDVKASNTAQEDE